MPWQEIKEVQQDPNSDFMAAALEVQAMALAAGHLCVSYPCNPTLPHARAAHSSCSW